MDISASFRPGDPFACAIGRSDEAVERLCEFDDYMRPTRSPLGEVRSELGRHLVFKHADGDVDARLLKSSDALPRNKRVGVGHADHHSGNARVDKRFSTRAGATGVATRFERGEHRGALGRVTSGGDRLAFGVLATRLVCRSVVDHAIGIDEHCADPRIGS